MQVQWKPGISRDFYYYRIRLDDFDDYLDVRLVLSCCTVRWNCIFTMIVEQLACFNLKIYVEELLVYL